jgi:selenocysteine lyase/cysteine desulfurase
VKLRIRVNKFPQFLFSEEFLLTMLESTLDLSPLRAQFPALQETDAQGQPYVYFDGPGGTQAPTSVVAAMKAGLSPRQVAACLGEQGIFVWHSNYLALRVTDCLGLEESGGLVRAGLVHYNTLAEVERLLAALRAL